VLRDSGVLTGPRPQTSSLVVGVPFAADLRRHGDRLAVVAPGGGRLTYAELADRVDAVVTALGTTRRLVVVPAANELDPLVTYLAALSGGHPVLLTATDARADRLIDRYDPDVVLSRVGDGWIMTERRAGSVHTLHPDLAVLLSTSGSTGSAKLVRLSAANLQANAESIAGYLGITSTDRAMASLPMHYCYGLSVINSNLLRGAAVVLTDASVVDTRFWELARAEGVTSLHGVPHTFELLRRLGTHRLRLPSLRYVTQAGGAMPADQVRDLAELGRVAGWRLFVMYGQTEATARMAYLPPELAATHPHTIGVPIPGGSFDILPSAVPGQGELVYRGPNVMLGYARSVADLSLGRTVHELRTGDLARRTPEGLYQVVGRVAQFVKILGLRIDLREAERRLSDLGHTVTCAGSDDRLVIAVSPVESTDSTLSQLTTVACRGLGLPASHLRVITIAETPRLTNGKIDYPALLALADRERPADQPVAPVEPRDVETAARALRAKFAAVLGRNVPMDASFVDLGGDSLRYVQMSVEVERIIGHLPTDWHLISVVELASRAADRPRRRRPSVTGTIESGILLRALAITLVVGTHLTLFDLQGGAHLLLVIAGASFARFCLADSSGDPTTGILRTVARVAVPAVLFLAWRALDRDTTLVSPSNVLLVNSYVRDGAGGYWFIEVFVHIMLGCALLLAVPAVRAWERRHRFTFALGVLTSALLLNLTAHDGPDDPQRAITTHGVLWFFALGWLAHRADSPLRRIGVLVLGLSLIPGYFGDQYRESIVIAGLSMLLFVPRLRLPRPLLPAIGLIACASLYIYLTHFAIIRSAGQQLPAIVLLPLCLAVGIATWYVTDRAAARLLAHLASRRARHSRDRDGDRGGHRPERTDCPIQTVPTRAAPLSVNSSGP